MVLLDPLGRVSGAEGLAPQPLGSLWKAFVYAYVVETGAPAPDYSCEGKNEEDKFCCEKGGRVSLHEALQKSCGPFFRPARLGLEALSWRGFWAARGFREPWLLELARLAPATRVAPSELLGAFRGLRALKRFPELENRLLEVVAHGTGSVAAREFGGLLRAKTYTWDAEEPSAESTAKPAAERLQGGFAGYLQDGSVIWFRGAGASKAAIASARAELLPLLEEHSVPGGGCVRVRHAAGYPLARVVELATGRPASPGRLHGAFRAEFRNGNRLEFRSAGETELREEKSGPALQGTYSFNGYVARVLQREGSPEPAEAAKALAVVARSYLFRHARLRAGCYEIEDSTRRQRVSLDLPSAQALRAAAFSAPLVLAGVDARYHTEKSGVNLLSWNESARLAREGFHYDELLARAFPAAKLLPAALAREEAACAPLARANAWLTRLAPAWARALSPLPGFEPVRAEVCRGRGAKAHADRESDRIFLPAFRDTEDELSLAHEYVHLAFQRHPSGLDEKFVERQARRLVTNPRPNGGFP